MPAPSKPHPDHTPLGTSSPPPPDQPQPSSNTTPTSIGEDVDTPLPKMTHCKVDTWLKNRSYSDLDESIPSYSHPKDHTSLDKHAPLHVHFADELCACADDAKSIGSSHTSGIVTDYPSSPKLAPACCCPQCNSGPSFKDNLLNAHCVDELSMPSCDKDPPHVDASSSSVSSESTLCPSTVNTIQRSHSVDIDTPIDEPAPTNSSHLPNAHVSSVGDIQRTKTRLSFRDVHAKSVYRTGAVPSVEKGRGHHNKGASSKNHDRKVPETPKNVSITHARRQDSLLISWDPVK